MKFCKECKHASAGGTDWIPLPFGGSTYIHVPWKCNHPSMADPVTGICRKECESARGISNSVCGPDGKCWEEGEPEAFKPKYQPPDTRWVDVTPEPPKRRWWHSLFLP